jgi:hypothetical protein
MRLSGSSFREVLLDFFNIPRFKERVIAEQYVPGTEPLDLFDAGNVWLRPLGSDIDAQATGNERAVRLSAVANLKLNRGGSRRVARPSAAVLPSESGRV